MSENFKIRRYKSDDFEAYKNLYKSVYEKDIDEKYFLWKHSMNITLTKEPLIYLILNENDEIIGANSFFACLFRNNNEEIKAVQSGDTMVSNEYRGKGLFKKIIIYALEDLKNDGYGLVFGFANKNSFPGFARLGFSCLYKINLYVKVLNYKSMLSNKLRNIPGIGLAGTFIDKINYLKGKNTGKNYKIESLENASDEIIGYISSCYSGKLHQKKDSEYITWKYRNKPDSKYDILALRDKNSEEILAVIVVRIDENGNEKSGKLVEVFTQNSGELSNYLSAINHYYVEKGHLYLEIWDTGNNIIEPAVKSSGYIKREIELYFILKTLNEEFKNFDSTESWFVLAGDSDTA